MPTLVSLGLPLRLGLAIPWVVGASSDRPVTGLFLRLLFESEREQEYESGEGGCREIPCRIRSYPRQQALQEVQ
jgi:hypothetical protein